ncbi:MAG: SBBP repeat-containing protein [Acidobacteria bacterium]|nr:SBBP repeat-containing protein [Acidobacteriota bacterium]
MIYENAAHQPGGGGGDAYIAKVNAEGTALMYATYLGGSGDDMTEIDPGGNTSFGNIVVQDMQVFVSGTTTSADFPTVNALQPAFGGIRDAFVAKLNATGSAIVYSTYLGGAGSDSGYSIAVDGSGNAYATGVTDSMNYPTANALQLALGGGIDAFVTMLNPEGSALVYSTYLGGSLGDQARVIALDFNRNVYVVGVTSSTNFPTANGFQTAYGGGVFDVFVTKLNAAGTTILYSTYLGGEGADAAYRIAVDSSGNAYVAGRTGSANFPTVNPFQAAYGGGTLDAFIAKIAP